ncbi:MAG: PEP-CTERM sorting domain-containing protein [Tepidisphaeraceae bacterium]
MLGFTDVNHTQLNGSRFSAVTDMSATGFVIGNQTRYENGVENATGQTAWLFQPTVGLTRLGLFDDTEHVDNDDVSQTSTVRQLNDLGHAVGDSLRYRFVPTNPLGNQWVGAGQSAWLAVNGVSTRIGLIDGEHSTADGQQSSSIVKLNALGDVVGNSGRFKVNASFGQSAFIHTGGTTTRIGLFDAEHTRQDTPASIPTFQSSTVGHLNDLGDAAGVSNRYNDGPTQLGQSAWLRTADGTTSNIGLVDDEHTKSTDGTRVSSVFALNNTEDDITEVVGHANRYQAGTGAAFGQSAWYHSGGSTQVIGLVDTDHTQGNGAVGAKSSTVQQLNNAGYARGISTRFFGSTASGQSAWVFNSATGTTRVGLTDDEHTGTNGLQSSSATQLNLAGNAAGTSSRFTGANVAAGTSAWVFREGSSTRIGFFDDTHTRGSDENQTSSVTAINDDGEVIGQSTRYRSGETIAWGSTAWVSDGATTTRIGLFDNLHTRHPGSDDFQSSTVSFLNDEGQATGVSSRFDAVSAASLGQSGWFYDDTLDQTFELVFSTRTDGFANTNISFLTDNGIALGFYTLYSGGATVGNRAFLWDFNQLPAERFHDLGTLVEDGLPASGWQALTSAIEMSDFGHIRGQGTLLDGVNMPYILSPVPEPTGLALLAVGGLAMMPRRRRKE